MRLEVLTGRACLAVATALGAVTAFPHAGYADVYLDVVISELMYHAPGGDEVEFIELTNRGTQNVDLAGWRIDDGVRYTFPPGVLLPPGGRVVIAGDPAAVQSFYGLPSVLGPFEGRLDNGGERIELRDAADALVCEVTYDDEAPWPTGGDDDGRSIELIDLWKNHNVGRHWAPSQTIMGTPGAPNGTGAPPPVKVVINEFLADPGDGFDWLELYNYGDTTVDLNGYYLTDDPENPTKARITTSWYAGTTIAPKGYWISTQGDWGFGLSKSGEQLYLVAPDGKTWVDGYDFGDQFENITEGRYPDGSDNWVRPATPTFNGPNTAPATVQTVVINEIMYHPPGDNDVNVGPEYVELHNRSGQAIDITGWSLAHGIDYEFPPGTMIPANGYLVVAADPAAVQAAYGISGVLGPYEGKLSNFSDEIELEDHLGNRVDFVEYRQEGLWPTSADGDGKSLELANYTLDNRLPGAWRASVGNGTPGAANSQSISNPPASIDRVKHAPLVPTATQSVTVTALVGAGNLTSVKLYYKRDQDGSFASTDMYDDGQHGDEQAGDGLYGGVIPPYANGTVVEFYIQANATGGNKKFPDLPPSLGGLPAPTCLYVVENAPPTSNLNVFRFVITSEYWNSITADPWNDTARDCTFIYGDKAYYNSGIRFRSGSRTGPKYSYKVHLTAGYDFRDADVFNLNYEKADITLLKNKIINHLLGYMGLPDANTEFTHVRRNGSYVGVHLYAEAHDNDYLDNNFPGDSDGNMYKGVSPWTTSVYGVPTAWGDEPDNRWFEKETNELLWDWSDLDNLYQAMSQSSDANYEALVRQRVDVPNWGRSMAVWAVTCLIDSPWHINNQNYRLYRRFSDNRFIHILYDFDDTYWPTMWNNAGPYVSAFNDVQRFQNWPAFQREYLHGIWRAVNTTTGVYRESRILPEVAYYHGLIYNDVDADPITGTGSKWTNFVNGKQQWNDWLTGRNSLLRGMLPNATLAITSPTSPYTSPMATVTLTGTAPISAPRLEVFGGEDGIQWLSATQWRKTITLTYQSNQVVVRTLDDAGNELERATIAITYPDGLPGQADFTTDPLPSQPPYDVQFYDLSEAINITGWHWDFGDGFTSTEQDPLHTYADQGTYTVTLTITADHGPFVAIKEITVGAPPEPIPGDFDGDGDVDQDDFGRFQSCLSGPGAAQYEPACHKARLDEDDDVDSADLAAFQKCMTGANVPGDPECLK